MIELTKEIAVLMIQSGLVGFALAHLFWCIYLYRESNRESERLKRDIERDLAKLRGEPLDESEETAIGRRRRWTRRRSPGS